MVTCGLHGNAHHNDAEYAILEYVKKRKAQNQPQHAQ